MNTEQFSHHLEDFLAVLILVAIESSIDLSFAPCGQNPDDILIAVVLVLDFLMDQLSFLLCQCHVHLVSFIPV